MDIEPKKTFYVALTSSRDDGMLDLESEVPQVYGSLSDAVGSATDEVVDHGMTIFIFECHPVRRVHRSKKISVEKISL